LVTSWQNEAIARVSLPDISVIANVQNEATADPFDDYVILAKQFTRAHPSPCQRRAGKRCIPWRSAAWITVESAKRSHGGLGGWSYEVIGLAGGGKWASQAS
jgi:hypothetical protein